MNKRNAILIILCIFIIGMAFGIQAAYAKDVNSTNATVKNTTENTTKNTTVKSTSATKNKTTVNVKRYYSRFGISPDGKYIMAIGRPSASGELRKYGYRYYKTVLYRKCPMCGSNQLFWGIFWAGNEKSNWGRFPATGRRESGSLEGHIFCKRCDADYSIFGHNHNRRHKSLKVYKKAVRSSKSEAYSLKKGKIVYDTIKKTKK